MKELYYDRWEFLQAYNLIHSDPIQSKKLFQEYIEKYPSDYSAQNYYVFLLIVFGKIEEANDFLNNMEQSMYYNSKFCNYADKIKYVVNGIFLNRIRILARKEEYKELYAFYIRNRQLFDDYDLFVIPFYCKSKLGLIDKNKDYSSYLYGQIANYRDDEFLKHVERHTADYNMNLDNPNSSIFASSFPLENIIEEIKKLIPTSDIVNVPLLLKKYRKMLATVPPDVLSKIAMKERESVKDFILDAKYPAGEVFSPHIIQALVTSVEEKVNDYKEKVHKR